MISCTRLAVPGIIVSMLLAGQALASGTPPADEEAVLHKMAPASVEQRPTAGRTQTMRRMGRARRGSPAGSPTCSHSVARAVGAEKSSSYGRNRRQNVVCRHSHATLLIEQSWSFREDQGLISQTTVG